MADHFEKFNQLNAMVTVEEVFDFIGARVDKTDGYKTTYACPYHSDDLPSLIVDKQRGMFNCFACDCGGSGAYACAKYYLQFTNNVKPTALEVVSFLQDINPNVIHIRHLFTVRQVREYDHTVNKRKQFNNRLGITTKKQAIEARKKRFTDEQIKIYIDSIMTGMPEEFMFKTLNIEKGRSGDTSVSKELEALLGDD